ncbi:replication initiation and membrane attachment family protein [Enterococcus sp. LJL98]
MDSTWEKITPNTIYQVFKALPLTQEGKDGLLYLYQPIIGAQALALYLHFIGDESDRQENEFIHLDCLNALNVGLPAFLEARKRLEGMGLLTVYEKEEAEFGKIYLYQLEEPLAPKAFMEDVTYSFLLTQAVGERKFKQLAARFRPKTRDVSAYREVTANFTTVYGNLDLNLFSVASKQLEKTAQEYAAPKAARLKVATESLDWHFLMALASKKFIVKENFTEAFKTQLSVYANLYGYTELELVDDVLAQVVALDTGLIDPKKLKQFVERKHQTRFQDSSVKAKNHEAEEQRYALLRQTGYSEKDVALIRTSETTAPFDFLEAIKTEKNSYVTDSEKWLLKSLVERSPLPNAVINILLHYVLVIQKNSTLQTNFVHSIATNWSEKGFQSPETAIQYVREYVRESKEKQAVREQAKTNRKTSYSKAPIRKEALPDWVTKPKVVEENPEKQAELNRRLAAYLKRKEGEK